MKKQFQQEIGVIRGTEQLLKISKKWHCRLNFKYIMIDKVSRDHEMNGRRDETSRAPLKSRLV